MKAVDPQGHTYSVTRRWMPWRRRLTNIPDSALDLSAVGGGDFLGVVASLALVLLIPVLLLVLFFSLEFLVLLVLLPLAILARLLLRLPWEVEVRRRSGLVWRVVHSHRAGSWSDSGQQIRALAADIESGTRLRAPGTP